MASNEPSDSALTEPPSGQRFELAASRLEGGYVEAIGRGMLATLPIVLAFMCPFVWAAVVFQILKRADINRRTFESLLTGMPARLEVDDPTIRLVSIAGTTTTIDKSEVVDGWLEQSGDSSYVVVTLTRERRLMFQLRHGVSPESVLSALGVSARQQTARFTLTSPAVDEGQGGVYHLLGPWLFLTMFLAVVGAIAAMPFGDVARFALATVSLGLVSLLGWSFARRIRRSSALVGRDGVTINRAGKQRFVSFADLRGMAPLSQGEGTTLGAREGIVLSLADGDVTLKCGSFAVDDPGTLAALEARIQAGWDAYREGETDEEGALELLERRGRNFGEWRDDLLALVRKQADYRVARLNPVHLTETVEDVSAPFERRLGAAVALASQDDPELRMRIDLAARTCAHPRLRIALEQAANGELEAAALEEALEEEHGQSKK